MYTYSVYVLLYVYYYLIIINMIKLYITVTTYICCDNVCMHTRTLHDRPLIGVHLPTHRSICKGSIYLIVNTQWYTTINRYPNANLLTGTILKI